MVSILILIGWFFNQMFNKIENNVKVSILILIGWFFNQLKMK